MIHDTMNADTYKQSLPPTLLTSPTSASAPVKRRPLVRLFPFLKKDKSSAANRRHTRHQLACIGKVSIVNSASSMEGIITEISKGGIKFRPAKAFILIRQQTQVSVEFSGIKLSGNIVATRSDGYGIALFEVLSDETVQDALEKSDKQIYDFIYKDVD